MSRFKHKSASQVHYWLPPPPGKMFSSNMKKVLWTVWFPAWPPHPFFGTMSKYEQNNSLIYCHAYKTEVIHSILAILRFANCWTTQQQIDISPGALPALGSDPDLAWWRLIPGSPSPSIDPCKPPASVTWVQHNIASFGEQGSLIFFSLSNKMQASHQKSYDHILSSN